MHRKKSYPTNVLSILYNGQVNESIRKLRTAAVSFPDVADYIRSESKVGFNVYEEGMVLEIESLLMYALNSKSVQEMMKLLRSTLTRLEGQPGSEKKILGPILKRARAALRSGGTRFE